MRDAIWEPETGMEALEADFETDFAEEFVDAFESDVDGEFDDEAPFNLEAEDEWELRRRTAPRLRRRAPPRRGRPALRPRPPVRPPRPPIFRAVPRAPACVCPAHGTEFVRWVQSTLNQLFRLNLRINGVMNRATREALRRFQQQQGLTSDGIAGPDTERALMNARGGGSAGATRTAVAEPAAPPESALAQSEFENDAEELEAPIPRPTLRHGSRGAAVVELQRRLAALGFSPGAADGIFGSRTKAAVMEFQRSRRIAVDGIVGQQTWGQLYGRAPAPAPAPTPAPSTAPRWAPPAAVIAAGDVQTVRYDSPAPWANGAGCTDNFTDGAADLRRHILANFAGITSIGGYSCRVNSANPSETSVHGVGRALDVMIPTVRGNANSAMGDPIANWLIRNASAIGVQYIIWNRMRWAGHRTPHLGNYTGPSPHVDHIHVELNLAGSRRETPWFTSGSGRGAAAPNEEFALETDHEFAPEVDSEIPHSDPKTVFQVWAPLVTLWLHTKSPASPTTRSVTCFINKLLKNWNGTDSRYINRDRAQTIFYKNYADFDTAGFTDSLKKDLLRAAKWSKDPQQFYGKVIGLDHTVRNGLARMNALYNVQGDSSASVKRMNSWAMQLQSRSSSILSCYR